MMSKVFLLLLLLAPSPCQAWGLLSSTFAAAVLTSLPLNDGQQLLKSLTPPTDTMPQIVMPPRAQDVGGDKDEIQPIVQGLVYLTNQQLRPMSTDFLVLEVRTTGDAIVAGAKIPISRVRFPMQFAMSEKNILPGKQMVNNDLLVDAKVCPSPTTCAEEDASFKAKGIAKMISNLPGSDGTSMRAGASLGLR